MAAFNEKKVAIIDARTKGRFDGSEPDPRQIPSGHIPASTNLPLGSILKKVSKDDLTPPSLRKHGDLINELQVDYLWHVEIISDTWTEFLGSASLKEIAAPLLNEFGPTGSVPIITTCGSGIQASALWFAFHEILGIPNVSVYDGSWTEWASNPMNPIQRNDSAPNK